MTRLESALERSSAARNLSLVLVSVCFGLQFGFNYGVSNHNTYLLRGLRMFDPTILANDWLATQTTDYHGMFSYIVYALYSLTPSGWSFAIANCIFSILGAVVMYKILAYLTNSRHVILMYLLLMGALAVTATATVSGSYIFAHIFQPSTIGGLGFLIAVYYFFKKRYFLSGLCLAVGGMFHANYLVLGFPVFLLAHVFLGVEALMPRLVRQFVLPCLALVPFIGIMLKTAGAPDAGAGQMILFNIRSPHHYDPLFFYKGFVGFIGWIVLGCTVGWRAFPDAGCRASFRALYYSVLIVIGVGTLLTSAVFVPAVAQLYVWRIAPIAVLLSQMMMCAGVIRLLTEAADETRISRFVALVMLGAIAFANARDIRYETYRLAIVCLIAFVCVYLVRKQAGRWRFWRQGSLTIVTLFCVAVWLTGIFPPLIGLADRSVLIKGLPVEQTSLHEWARTTPKGSVFLVPPGFQRFRLHSQRAIVVDWKSTPIMPSELLDWYERIQTISQTKDVSTRAQAEDGYAALKREDLQRIQKKYDFDYAVFRKGAGPTPTDGCELKFENTAYFVLSLLDSIGTSQPWLD